MAHLGRAKPSQAEPPPTLRLSPRSDPPTPDPRPLCCALIGCSAGPRAPSAFGRRVPLGCGNCSARFSPGVTCSDCSEIPQLSFRCRCRFLFAFISAYKPALLPTCTHFLFFFFSPHTHPPHSSTMLPAGVIVVFCLLFVIACTIFSLFMVKKFKH